MRPSILGYVMARDAWPMIGLSITHAFNLGLEHIIVVNHRSTDDTTNGLNELKQRWPGKLTVLELDTNGFPQELTTGIVMDAFSAQSYDWVYVFDADEFMLVNSAKALPEVLASVPPEVHSIRYEIQQWIAPADMDDSNIVQYSRFTQKAIACDFVPKSGEILFEELVAGEINYFDVPFPSKVIVRGKLASQLVAGAHGLKISGSLIEQTFSADELICGHIPLVSKRRLLLKAKQGKRLIEAGLPRYHGWQNQALHFIERAGGIDKHWFNHSIPGTPDSAKSNCHPCHIEDKKLSRVLQNVIKSLMGGMTSLTQNGQPDQRVEGIGPSFDLGSLVSHIQASDHAWQTRLDALKAERDQQKTQIKQLEESMKTLAEDKASLNYRNQQLQETVLSLLTSSSWRITTPLRDVTIRLRALKSKLRGAVSKN